MTLRILMFGRTGQVAREVLRRSGGDVAVAALGREQVDLTRPEVCARVVAEADADVIINAAAFTAVDRAEDDIYDAWLVNAVAPGVMARAAAARGLPFLHLSTDYVFDGSGDHAWREDDPVAPLGVYGRTKAAGERAVTEAGGAGVILRTSWVFSAHGENFVRTMLRLGAVRDELSVVQDQRGGPTPASAIADTLIAIAWAFKRGEGNSGVFHFAGAPAASWCEFARAIFAEAQPGREPRVVPISSADWPARAKRPLNSRLDCGRINEAYGLPPADWRRALRDVIAELKETAA